MNSNRVRNLKWSGGDKPDLFGCADIGKKKEKRKIPAKGGKGKI